MSSFCLKRPGSLRSGALTGGGICDEEGPQGGGKGTGAVVRLVSGTAEGGRNCDILLAGGLGGGGGLGVCVNVVGPKLRGVGCFEKEGG